MFRFDTNAPALTRTQRSSPIMKVSTLLLSFVGTALALPALHPRAETAVAVTDQILFSISLPAFTTRRNARNPPTLNWSSDDCTSSPDNPLGFPFKPACHRHDFGYNNYRAQNRFTTANKLSIDDNFKKEYARTSTCIWQQGANHRELDSVFTTNAPLPRSVGSAGHLPTSTMPLFGHLEGVMPQREPPTINWSTSTKKSWPSTDNLYKRPKTRVLCCLRACRSKGGGLGLVTRNRV